MEHIPEKKTHFVILPDSLLKALYALQKEPTGYEWGGGVDFEMITGYPQIERVLAYFAEKGGVSLKVWEKYGRDVEILFHTHPRQKRVQPSIQDITSFTSSRGQVEMIIAGEEIGLLEKRADFKTLIEGGVRLSLPVQYNPEWATPEIKKELDKIGIDFHIFPKKKDPPAFDLEIVKRMASWEHVS